MPRAPRDQSLLRGMAGEELGGLLKRTASSLECSSLSGPPGQPAPHHHFPSAGFQPKVQSRLVGGSSVCEGIAEVRQGSQWAALCDSSMARGRARWEELCQEQQCGNLLSFRALDADRTTPGLICTQEKLSRCYQLQKRNTCKRVFVTCELTAALGGWGTVRSFSSRT